MGRLGNIFRALWSKMLGRTEDKYYRELLDLGYEDFANMVAEVGTDLAGVAQSKHRMMKLISDAEMKASGYEQSAMKFLETGDEGSARAALDLKAQLEQQVAEFRAQLALIDERQSDLEATKKQLDLEVTKFQSNKEVLKARHTAAKATAKAAETVTGIGGQAMNIGRTVGRLRESTEQLEARGEGIKELMSKGALDNMLNPGQTPLDRSVAELERKSSVDGDLARLKKQLEPIAKS